MEQTSVSLLFRLEDSADNTAWNHFDNRYRAFILRFLQNRRVAFDVADDVCQNVMKRVYEALTDGRFQHNGHTGAFRNWLRRIVCTQLAFYRRRSDQTVPLPPRLEDVLSREDSRLARLWDEEHNRFVLDAFLERLREDTPADSLAIFRRTFVEGISADEAAVEFGRTKNAIIVARCKVLKKARELAARQQQ